MNGLLPWTLEQYYKTEVFLADASARSLRQCSTLWTQLRAGAECIARNPDTILQRVSVRKFCGRSDVLFANFPNLQMSWGSCMEDSRRKLVGGRSSRREIEDREAYGAGRLKLGVRSWPRSGS